jgi:site-specific DNA-cytosine methylase
MTATEFKSSPHINTRGGNNQPRRGTERILARLDRPSPTIMVGHDPIYNRQVRDELWGEIGGRLSTEQLAVLQGFPRGWSWAGTKHSQQRQIGNAVPPPMAEALGRALLSLSPAPTAPTMATAPAMATAPIEAR